MLEEDVLTADFNQERFIIRKKLLVLLIFLIAKIASGQKPADENISVFFNEIKEITKQNFNLWSTDLYGAILLVDPKTRQVFSNEADSANVLKPFKNIYSGILPQNINIANTSVDFNGKRWAMIMLPLPKNKKDRVNLLAHELFHRVQPSLGFVLYNTENNHLNEKNGRIYLRLELEALSRAIQTSSKKEMLQYLNDALVFRKYRQNLYNNSNITENQLELNEGIAEFTGVIMSGRNNKEMTEHFTNAINDFFKNSTFVRSFAYQTIPIYGYFLYNKNKNWNKEISINTDLTDYFIKSFKVKIPDDLEYFVKKKSKFYNGDKILEEEKEREEKIKKVIADYKSKFIVQPHFEIQLLKMNMSFDPRNIIPLEDKGTVYPNIRITDLWGILTVENGALISSNWDKVTISNPIKIDEKKIIGDGWSLELADSYTINKVEKNDNYILIKE